MHGRTYDVKTPPAESMFAMCAACMHVPEMCHAERKLLAALTAHHAKSCPDQSATAVPKIADPIGSIKTPNLN